MPNHPSTSLEPGWTFPGWSAALNADVSLLPGLRAHYRQTVSRFLAFCAKRRTGPTVAVAREFVELARLEDAPSPARLQEWKEALNWYFRRGREVSAVMLKGVPPLARTDQGQTAWEAALIAGLRERHLAWRTEQTYRGWMWRFVKWRAGKQVIDASPSGAREAVRAPHRIRPVATYSPERRRNLPERGGEGGALADAGAVEVRAFLSHLAVAQRVGVAAQKQAFTP